MLTKGGFETDINISSKVAPVVSIQVQGLAIRHATGYDSDGQMVNTQYAHVTLSQADLIEKNYPLTDVKGQISFRGHKVNFIDSSGVLKYYTVGETFPDETVGMIVLQLERATNG
jgi:hypothetical protein